MADLMHLSPKVDHTAQVFTDQLVSANLVLQYNSFKLLYMYSLVAHLRMIHRLKKDTFLIKVSYHVQLKYLLATICEQISLAILMQPPLIYKTFE